MITIPPLYPLKFEPILKQKVWGGSKLGTSFKKLAKGNIGESWEISGVSNDVSEIANGQLKGKLLSWLLEFYKEKLVGEKVYEKYENSFPLLFKFIDAREDLSVQVHPDDALAKERHNSFGKTELWYILEVEKNARLILGFNERVKNKKQYLELLSNTEFTEVLNSIPVQKGDVFMLKPGTVHAIGAGILLAEIQQSSDITYRIYDWDRTGSNGEIRQLHTDMALDAIDFGNIEAKQEYVDALNTPVSIGETPFFSVNKLTLAQNYTRSLGDISSFVVYMCLEGAAVIESNGFIEEIEKGETILIPAQLTEIKFITNSVSFLEVYIP